MSYDIENDIYDEVFSGELDVLEWISSKYYLTVSQ